MIDCSHDNSGKDPAKQVAVGDNVAEQIAAGDARIFGVMVESHLKAGRQDLIPGKDADLRPKHHRRLRRLGRHAHLDRYLRQRRAPTPR